MSARPRRSGSGEVKVDLTPLIDCVFLLIVFFIVAGKFKKVESRLNAYLPKNVGIIPEDPCETEKFFVSILCLIDDNTSELVWKVNDKAVRTRTELVEVLDSISSTIGKDTVVTIDGEPGVHFYWIVASLDACAEADLTEIVFAPPRLPVNQWPRPETKNIELSAFYSK